MARQAYPRGNTRRVDLPDKTRLKAAACGPRTTDGVLADNRAVSNHRLAEKLADSSMFREYQRAFEKATSMPLSLRAVESWQLAHTHSKKQNAFCALLAQTNNSCAACLQMQQRVCDGVNGAPATMSCAFGLVETAVGVKIGREFVVYLQTGQVFFKPRTPDQTNRALKRIREWGFDLDHDDVAKRYEATPVVRRDAYQARVKLLQFFADQLGTLANQIVLSQRCAEPPHITRARQLIDAQFQQNITLASISRQVGMSSFYFCKQFKKTTGVNYTDYVSRVRVEKAKNLLLNPNYRVSEIGYEIGFKSLTHFNRVFKRIVRESPTEYRQHLAIA
jgi:AraC-like DNA-binding protein